MAGERVPTSGAENGSEADKARKEKIEAILSPDSAATLDEMAAVMGVEKFSTDDIESMSDDKLDELLEQIEEYEEEQAHEQLVSFCATHKPFMDLFKAARAAGIDLPNCSTKTLRSLSSEELMSMQDAIYDIEDAASASSSASGESADSGAASDDSSSAEGAGARSAEAEFNPDEMAFESTGRPEIDAEIVRVAKEEYAAEKVKDAQLAMAEVAKARIAAEDNNAKNASAYAMAYWNYTQARANGNNADAERYQQEMNGLIVDIVETTSSAAEDAASKYGLRGDTLNDDVNAIFERVKNGTAGESADSTAGSGSEAAANNTTEGAAENNAGTNENDSNNERQKKRKRAGSIGRRVAIIASAAALLAGGVAGTVAAMGGHKGAKQASEGTQPAYEMTLDDDDEANYASEIIDENEARFDKNQGRETRGAWADKEGKNSNSEKGGEHDLNSPKVLEQWAGENSSKLNEESERKALKEALNDSYKEQSLGAAMMADYAKTAGFEGLLPDSIKDLSGDALEEAIKTNKDGCFDELKKNMDYFFDNADVSYVKLNGNYNNYYVDKHNENGDATIDNLDLVAISKYENGSEGAFIISGTLPDGSTMTMMVKEGCTQIVTRIEINKRPPKTETPPTTTTTTTETTPPTTTTTTTETTPLTTTTTTTETTPPTTTTTTTETSTTTTTTETTPQSTTTTTETTTTTTHDDSKHEGALHSGQGGDVAPVTSDYKETAPETFTRTEVAYDKNDAAQGANDAHVEDVNRTAKDAAEAAAREQARKEQEKVDQNAASTETNMDEVANNLFSGF